MRPKKGQFRGARLVPLVALAGFLIPGAAFARDRPPLPDPLPCPLDVPVRVASDDTLKRFTALDDCAPDRILVAPLDRPLPARAPVEIEPADGPMLHAARAKRAKGKIGDISVEQARVGAEGVRVVRIVPVLPPPEPPVRMVAEPADAGLTPVSATDEAILSLRPATYSSPYDGLIADAAVRHRVDPLMLHSVIKQESSYRPQAMSHVGARGLMQIMPGTGADLGVRDPALLMNPAVNIDAGARLLRRLWTRMNGRFDLVLAAYNAGEGAVRRFGMRVPPFAETQGYVSRVQNIYQGLAAGAGLLQAR